MPKFSTRRLITGLTSVSLCFGTTKVAAELIEYEVTGNTSSGETYSLTARIDTDTAVLTTSSPSGVDFYQGTIDTFHVDIGNTRNFLSGTGGRFDFARRNDVGNNILNLSLFFDTRRGAEFNQPANDYAPATAILDLLRFNEPTLNTYTSTGFPIGVISIGSLTECHAGLFITDGPPTISGSISTPVFGKIVPEPSSAATLGLGALALLRRKKKHCRG